MDLFSAIKRPEIKTWRQFYSPNKKRELIKNLASLSFVLDVHWFPLSISSTERTPFAPVCTVCNSIRMCSASTRSTLPHYFEVHFRSAVNMNANAVEIDTNECADQEA